MITAFLGNLSAGKTCLCVRCVFGLAADTGRKVFANIALHFPKPYDDLYTYIPTEDFPKEVTGNPERFQDSIILLDEAAVILEARRSSAGVNLDFTQFITQLGKLGVDLFYTAQILTSQIDLRLRELGDLYVFCNRMVFINGVWRPAYTMPRILPKETPIMIDAVAVLRIMGGLQQKINRFKYLPKEFDFSLYDTREIVMVDRERFKKPKSPFFSS